ncbi:MAG: CBS domain-containing protein [Planctomycetaceae bacterium]
MLTTRIPAHEIMTRHLVMTTADAHVVEASERLIAQGISGMPVVDSSGRLEGRFSERTAIAALDLSCLQRDSRVAAALKDIHAADLMDRWGLVLKSHQDVFASIGELVSRRVSGAPVVDMDGTLRGVFSEQSAMHVFIGLCWEQLPSSRVTAWVDRDDERWISEETNLVEILDRFHRRAFRRLMVMHGNKLVGQVTRRDALKAAIRSSREPLAASRHLSADSQMGLRTDVGAWMHREAESIGANDDTLRIARTFLESGARQLPVLNDGSLVGQVSRSDLLRAVQKSFPSSASSESGIHTLYLTSVNKRDVREFV